MTTARAGEQGYVLIAAIWLLVLAGAIVALLMLSGVRLSRQARDDGAILRVRLALDAAVETIIADRVVNGDRSIWSRAPAEATLDIDGLPVHVRSTSEGERIDINRADPRVIDAVLQRAGVTAEKRQLVLGRLAQWRGTNQPIKAMADLDALFAPAGDQDDSNCIAEQFTAVLGGRVTLTDIDRARNGAGAVAGGAQSGEPLRGGAVQRLVLRTQEGMTRTAIFRSAGQRGRSAFLLDSGPGVCAGAQSISHDN